MEDDIKLIQNDEVIRDLVAACRQVMTLVPILDLIPDHQLRIKMHDVFEQAHRAIAKAESNPATEQADGKTPVVQPHRSNPAGALPAGD